MARRVKANGIPPRVRNNAAAVGLRSHEAMAASRILGHADLLVDGMLEEPTARYKVRRAVTKGVLYRWDLVVEAILAAATRESLWAVDRAASAWTESVEALTVAAKKKAGRPRWSVVVVDAKTHDVVRVSRPASERVARKEFKSEAWKRRAAVNRNLEAVSLVKGEVELIATTWEVK